MPCPVPPLSAQARRALSRAYKEAFPPMGVYVVRCGAAGILRLGARSNVDAALNRMRFDLARGTHRDKALQQAWLRHGPAAFTFEIIDRVKQRDDPAFDHNAELQALLALWEQELGVRAEDAS